MAINKDQNRETGNKSLLKFEIVLKFVFFLQAQN